MRFIREGSLLNKSRLIIFPQGGWRAANGNFKLGEMEMGKALIILVLTDAVFILAVIGLLRLKKEKKIKEGIASVLALLGLFAVMFCSLLVMILAALLVMR